jgi:hypothetical protein
MYRIFQTCLNLFTCQNNLKPAQISGISNISIHQTTTMPPRASKRAAGVASSNADKAAKKAKASEGWFGAGEDLKIKASFPYETCRCNGTRLCKGRGVATALYPCSADVFARH